MMPAVRPLLVPRPRLHARLSPDPENRLTLVCAPAGFGKTTALIEWLNATQKSTAWFSLDKRDNDPGIFWQYVIAALKSKNLDIGESTIEEFQSGGTCSIEGALADLINDINRHSRKEALAIDDYHLIEERAIHDSVSFFLEHMPPQLHLIIAARKPPPFPLNRLRIRNQVNEIRTADLRFTKDETADFLNKVMELHIPEKDVIGIANKCEGWIAAIQMAALYMRDEAKPWDWISSMSGSHAGLMDYLIEEVFFMQPREIQSFLQTTAILDRMTGRLCDAVAAASGSQAILDRLDAEHFMISPLDHEHRWYRYHYLLIDFLRKRIAQNPPGNISELHFRAGRWFDDNGLADEAIHHAQSAGRIDFLISLLEKHAPGALTRGDRTAFKGWLGAIPEKQIRKSPVLCICHAWSLLWRENDARFDLIEKRLEQAKAAAGPDPMEIDSHGDDSVFSIGHTIQGNISAIGSHLARLRGEPPEKIIQASKQALEALTEKDPVSESLIKLNLGLAHIAQGEYGEACRVMEELYRSGPDLEHSVITAIAAFTISYLSYTKGRLRHAHLTCEEALEKIGGFRSNSIHRPPIASILRICQGAVFLEVNDLKTAESALDESDHWRALKDWGFVIVGLATKIRLGIAQKKPLPELFHLTDRIEQLDPYFQGAKAYSGAWRIRILLAFREDDPGKLEAALSCMTGYPLSMEGRRESARHAFSKEWGQFEQLSVVRLLIALARQRPDLISMSDLHQAMSFLDRQLEKVEALDLKSRSIEILILKAMAFQATGKASHAVASIRRAMALAEPEGYVRLFIDEASQTARLIRQPAVLRQFPDYSRKLLSAYQDEIPAEMKPETGSNPGLVEPLSTREIEVLRWMASGISYPEIAGKLFIAMGTIKRHAYNIFGKLAVKNRTQAINRARELGLLAPNGRMKDEG